jgi:hypothetical protein
VLPRWLQVGIVARAIAPGLYRRGVVNDARREAEALARRRRSKSA